MTIEDIARTCHEVNRAYCMATGDNSQKSWEQADQWQRDSAVKGVEFAINNPLVTPRDMHNSWCNQKYADGWQYGLVKDAEQKTHPCLVAYSHLPASQQTKDKLFIAVVQSLARCMSVHRYL